MKTVTVISGVFTRRSETLALPQYKEADGLTPQMAQTAARLAVGHTTFVTVMDKHTIWRLNGNQIKQL